MPQILKSLIFMAYVSLIIHFIKTLNTIQEDIQIEYVIRPPGSLKKIQAEIKKKEYQYTVMELNYKKPIRLPTDLKYVLKWTEAFSHYSTSVFVKGQKPFLDNNCTFYNCFMTNDKSLLKDLRYFDAILFDVENNWDSYPPIRTPYQKYIFTSSEPASMYPVCDPVYASFYNATWTYKLDSTIPQPFFGIYDNNGTLVGPKADMTWITERRSISPKIRGKLMYKKKMAAWFASHCKTKSGREDIVSNLTKFLGMYNMSVDVYGWCGKLVCPKGNLEDCLEMLRSDYYFYLAFENSICEDYVTEKVLYALNHYTVPVVYGGADYSRFLPPNSYIDASKMSPASVASLMIQAIKTPDEYENYFRWHRHYTFVENQQASDVCKLCELLNDPDQDHSVVKGLNDWWNVKGDCQKDRGNVFIKEAVFEPVDDNRPVARYNAAFEQEAITPEFIKIEAESSTIKEDVSNEARETVSDEKNVDSADEASSRTSSKASSVRASRRKFIPWGKYEGQGVGS